VGKIELEKFGAQVDISMSKPSLAILSVPLKPMLTKKKKLASRNAPHFSSKIMKIPNLALNFACIQNFLILIQIPVSKSVLKTCSQNLESEFATRNALLKPKLIKLLRLATIKIVSEFRAFLFFF